MINNTTHSILSTTARTRIAAFLIKTSSYTRALWIDCTFRSTIRRCTDVIFKTRTRWTFATHLTNRIRTARTWFTRLNWYSDYYLSASSKWITAHTITATTYWVMIDNLATSVDSACAWTRIHTFIVQTSFGERAFSAYYTFGSATWRRSCLSWLARANSNSVINST